MNRARKNQRQRRVRAKITGTAERPRVCVQRTLRFVNAQVIDDVAGMTLVAVQGKATAAAGSSGSKTKTEQAQAVAKALAEQAQAKGIGHVVFDRSGYRYHGRVKAFAESLREHGLQF